MSIASGLSIASSGLAAIEQQMSVVSQNVANANTAGYSAETATLVPVSAQGLGSGVISLPATLITNASVQAQLNASVGNQSFQQTTASSLASIDQVMGTPGSGNDLTSLLGTLQAGFSTLLTDPSNTVQQSAVVSAAQNLSGQINVISYTIGAASQSAAANVVAGVTSLNKSLASIGTLNDQIISLAQAGKSTADLQNQRNALVQTVAALTGAKSLSQPNGTITLYTASGLQLPTNGSPGFATQGSGPTIMLGSQTVTASFTGGSIGAGLALTGTTLPQLQSGLDQLSQSLAGAFQGAGLDLFTTPAGTIPSGTAAAGFANQITVNPAVAATPSLVRDGTPTTLNPSGAAGFTGLIQSVLGSGFSSGGVSLATLTTNFVANQAALSGNAQTASTAASALTGALTTQASSTSGVSVDQQMGLLVTLQNAYAANAKVISIAQQMWQTEQAMIA